MTDDRIERGAKVRMGRRLGVADVYATFWDRGFKGYVLTEGDEYWIAEKAGGLWVCIENRGWIENKPRDIQDWREATAEDIARWATNA